MEGSSPAASAVSTAARTAFLGQGPLRPNRKTTPAQWRKRWRGPRLFSGSREKGGQAGRRMRRLGWRTSSRHRVTRAYRYFQAEATRGHEVRMWGSWDPLENYCWVWIIILFSFLWGPSREFLAWTGYPNWGRIQSQKKKPVCLVRVSI
jgi:hypothetical protein